MSSIKYIKELIRKAKVRNLHKKDQESSYRCAPLPPMSPFTHARDIVRERDADNKPKKKVIVLSDDIIKNIQKAGL